MKSRKSCLVALWLLLLCSPTLLAKEVTLSVATHDHTTKQEIDRALRLCASDTNHPDVSDMHRAVLEFYVLCKALRIGGIIPKFEYKSYPNSTRSRVQATSGAVLTRSFAPWLPEDNKKDIFYISEAVIPNGEFAVGIFTRPDHAKLLEVDSIEQLRQFTAVTNRNWKVDWQTLHCMKITTYDVSTRLQMYKMVAAKRADFVLDALSSVSKSSRSIAGIQLVPVPGVKVILNGSRHFLIHKSFAQSKKIFLALQTGLKKMRELGMIHSAYRESGFFGDIGRSWKKLQCTTPSL